MAHQQRKSRLQLAMRGLESERPLIRVASMWNLSSSSSSLNAQNYVVAVLDLNDTSTARSLVRLLLADPLDSKRDWEDVLDSSDVDISRGLLIR